jgi:phage regulator Rha-like protein
MNNLQLFNTNILTMSSIEIAELTNKRHADVLRDIRTQIFKGLYEINDNAENLYEEIQGVRIILDEYTKRTKEIIMDKYHTDILVSGYEVKYRAAIVKRWQDLEQEKLYGNFKLPTNYKEAVANLLETLEEKEKLEKQILLNKPKVEAFDNSKVIFSKKESVYDKERGYKTDIQEIYPFLASDKITLILDYYTKTRFEDTNHYVKEEALEIIEDFFIDADFQISPNKKIVFVKHPCLLNQNLKVKKDKAIKYLGYSEEDFQ